MPLQAYQFFIDKFVDAIRYEVARSAERAYESLTMQDMSKMFMITNEAELQTFIKQNNSSDGVIWRHDGSKKRVYFEAEKAERLEIPNAKMINLSLEYATEINRII